MKKEGRMYQRLELKIIRFRKCIKNLNVTGFQSAPLGSRPSAVTTQSYVFISQNAYTHVWWIWWVYDLVVRALGRFSRGVDSKPATLNVFLKSIFLFYVWIDTKNIKSDSNLNLIITLSKNRNHKRRSNCYTLI